MNFNFNEVLLDLEDQKIKDADGKEVIVGRVLAGRLANVSHGDALKFNDWARRLYKGEPINLDRSDCKTLREFVEKDNGNNALTNISKAAIIGILDAGKE